MTKRQERQAAVKQSLLKRRARMSKRNPKGRAKAKRKFHREQMRDLIKWASRTGR